MHYLLKLPETTGLLEDTSPVSVIKSRDYSRVRMVLITTVFAFIYLLIFPNISIIGYLDIIFLSIIYSIGFIISYNKYYIIRIKDNKLIVEKIISWWIHFKMSEYHVENPSIQISRYSSKKSGPAKIIIRSEKENLVIKTSNYHAADFKQLVELCDHKVEVEIRIGKKK